MTASNPLHPEAETDCQPVGGEVEESPTDMQARVIAELERLRDLWDMDCSMGEGFDMPADWVRKAEWRYKRVGLAIEALNTSEPHALAPLPPSSTPSQPEAGEGERLSGQLLQRAFSETQETGWVEPLQWDDFDAGGQKRFERAAAWLRANLSGNQEGEGGSVVPPSAALPRHEQAGPATPSGRISSPELDRLERCIVSANKDLIAVVVQGSAAEVVAATNILRALQIQRAAEVERILASSVGGSRHPVASDGGSEQSGEAAASDRTQDLQSRLSSSEARERALRSALEAFVQASERFFPEALDWPPDEGFDVTVTVGDVVRARAAIAKATGARP